MKRNPQQSWAGIVLLFLVVLAVSQPAQAFFLFGKYRSETVTYTPAGWPAPLQGDLYVPKDKKKAPYPVVLLLHGGAWHKGDKENMKKAGELLAEHGYAAFAINYRLAPLFRYPAPVEDAQQALRWLQHNAGRYQLDTNRLAVWGYSAGAHLAALLGVQPLTTDVPAVRVVVAGGTPADLRHSDQPSVRAFLGGSRTEVPLAYEEASPITHVHPGLPAFLLYYGTADTLVAPSQSESFAKALQEAEVPVKLIRLEGQDHRGAALAARRHLPDILAFLDRYIRGAANRSAGVQ